MDFRLTSYFTEVACKRLVNVEVGDTEQHHQHELDGVTALRKMFGTEKRVFPTTFIWVGEEEDDCASCEASMTWYDARERHPTRTEYRLYFKTDFIAEHASAGDVFILGLKPDETLVAIVIDQNAAALGWLLHLFGVEAPGDRIAVRDVQGVYVHPWMRLMLSEMGIEVDDDTLLDGILARFGDAFPPARAFSAFARETMPGEVSIGAPDDALTAWMDHELRLFRVMERHMISDRLNKGFAGDGHVDEFLHFSLSVQNRRKSRAGNALENHLEHLFIASGVRFERCVRTEGRSKPDFLFPGAGEYHDPAFPANRLTMLGAKTSLKDRWRQVLDEADRIPVKHLITVQPNIPVPQFEAMAQRSLTLVIPDGIRRNYPAGVRGGIMTVADFIGLVKDKQSYL